MVGLFADVTEDSTAAVRSKVANFFAVVTDNRVASINVVAGLVAMTASAELVLVTKVDQNLPKTNKIRNRAFHTYLIMTDTILDMLPARLAEMAAATMNNIAVLRQSLDNSGVGHLRWCIEDLQIP